MTWLYMDSVGKDYLYSTHFFKKKYIYIDREIDIDISMYIS